MDSLQTHIQEIEIELNQASVHLTTLENNAHNSISEEIEGIQKALQAKKRRTEDVRSLLRAAITDESSHDGMKVSGDVLNLECHVDGLIGDLEDAIGFAEHANAQIMSYRKEVIELKGVRFGRIKDAILKASDDAKGLKSTAEAQLSLKRRSLRNEEGRLGNAQQQLNAKEIEVKGAEEEERSKLREVVRLEGEVQQAESKERRSRKNRRASTATVIVGTLLCATGVGAHVGIVVLSGAVIGGAGGVSAIHNQEELDRHRRRIRILRTSCGAIRSKIGDLRKQNISLITQRRAIQQQVDELRRTVENSCATCQEIMSQLSRTKTLSGQLESLDKRVESFLQLATLNCQRITELVGRTDEGLMQLRDIKGQISSSWYSLWLTATRARGGAQHAWAIERLNGAITHLSRLEWPTLPTKPYQTPP